jgi:hypothetical protein
MDSPFALEGVLFFQSFLISVFPEDLIAFSVYRSLLYVNNLSSPN